MGPGGVREGAAAMDIDGEAAGEDTSGDCNGIEPVSVSGSESVSGLGPRHGRSSARVSLAVLRGVF